MRDIGDRVRECWNAEESLVVGFETLARCHSRFLDDIGNSKDVQTTMELLKETFDTCMKGFEMHGLSERVDKGLEGMRVVMETSDCVQEGEEGGQPGIRMGICLQDVVYWLDVLERRVDAMLTKDDGVPDDESSGGAYMLWDISMADCLQENLDLLKYMVERIVAEARASALGSMTRESMAAMAMVARTIHMDWIHS